MNALERVYARLQGKPVDRLPNLCILMGYPAKELGISYRQYVTDYRLLVEADLRCCETYGIDLLCAISDPARESEGFGADVVLPENGVPYVRTPLIAELSDIGRLKTVAPETVPRMNDRLEACRLFKERAAGQYPVCGWVEGALAEACDLRSINTVMFDLLDEPEAMTELFEICTEQAIRFALAQVEAGADMIGIGDAACSLVGPSLYREFGLPYEQRIIQAIHNAGAKAKLHICGNISALLPDINRTGADIVDCDWMVPYKTAVEALPACSVSGNMDPVSILLEGTPDTVRNAVKACINDAGTRGVIAAGCEVPVATPPENLRAVADAILAN